jgi:hypothetical protein
MLPLRLRSPFGRNNHLFYILSAIFFFVFFAVSDDMSKPEKVF